VKHKAPFPWFGGKSRASDLIWSRLGDVPNYAEPFAGSLAVLFNRPDRDTMGNEVVNDKDCYVANVWRAMKYAPEQVAEWADNPVNEADLHARHTWLHGRIEFIERMKVDPDYYCPKIAGWWIWGLSVWIGDNFCRPKPQNSVPQLRTGGKGVARKVPHLRGGGKGVARKVPGDRTNHDNIIDWFDALSTRLQYTKVCCGDWTRVLTKAATFGNGTTAILLDPPYDTVGHDDVYGDLSRGVSAGVRDWAVSNGDNPELRISLCGYEGEHVMPADWECVEWKAGGGYGRQNESNKNAARERIWFSPHCLKLNESLF